MRRSSDELPLAPMPTGGDESGGPWHRRWRSLKETISRVLGTSTGLYIVIAVVTVLLLAWATSTFTGWFGSPSTPGSPSNGKPGAPAYPIGTFKDHISFGDSYTSERHPNDTATPSGGRTWDRFVADYTGATLYDFAVSGAICSDEYWPYSSSRRSRQIVDQLPLWLSTTANTKMDAATTVYSNWIGTNDLGVDGFLLGGESEGTNITTFLECNWRLWDTIYANGGRYFVILNEAPLQFTPLYAPIGKGGVGDNHFWPDKSKYDTHQYARHMVEATLLVNEAYAYGLPYQLLVANRWPGATVALYDVHSLLTDIYNDPSAYLDSPANSTGSWRNCRTRDQASCTSSPEAKSSFMWYDELHPSERTDEVVAKGFVDVVLYGNSSYATYWRSSANGLW